MLNEQIIKVTSYHHASSTIKDNITDDEIVKKMLYSISKIYLCCNSKYPDVITIRKYKSFYKEGFVVFFEYGDYELQYQKVITNRNDAITIRTRARREEADIDDYESMTGLFIEILEESLKV